MVRKALTVALASGIVAAFAGTVMSGEMDWGPYQVGDKRSGYTFSAVETRAMQDDDFANPAFIWIDVGEELWETVEGTEGKSCASCHADVQESMKGVATTYPKFDAEVGKLLNLELRINRERETRMGAKPWKYESRELLAMTAFVKNQSRGMPVNVSIDGPAAPFFEKGKEFYNQRRGQLDMACANCHMDYPDTMIRANRLSQGHANGFPTYRLKWQKLGSLHRRFRGCNKQVRAQPYPFGSDEYVNLELFLGWRDKALPVETPSVRM
jgi:sulfur-oxidizing protein SoxA